MDKPSLKCCPKMIDQIEEDDLVCVMTTKPFTSESTKPTVYLMSDGGYGGCLEIQFCPFCGTKIEFKKW